MIMLRLSDALENRQGGGAGTRMNVSWSAIEQITSGKLGRTMAVCPLCSANRRTPQKRHSKVLAVNLLALEFAVYYCNHCGTQGYAHPEKRSHNLDLAEQRQRPEVDGNGGTPSLQNLGHFPQPSFYGPER